MSYWLDKQEGKVELSKPKLWLLDLDDTLINSSKSLFPILHGKMTEYIEKNLGLDHQNAVILRQAYWRKYGTTFLGLKLNHGIDPNSFLHATHDFDVYSNVERNNSLRSVLSKLGGKKVLYTNSPGSYARQALKKLSLIDFFDEVVSSTDARGFLGEWLPKPNVKMMRIICARYKAKPYETIFVDDSLHNLSVAAKAGFRCVWSTQYRTNLKPTPFFVEARIRNLRELLQFNNANKVRDEAKRVRLIFNPYTDNDDTN